MLLRNFVPWLDYFLQEPVSAILIILVSKENEINGKMSYSWKKVLPRVYPMFSINLRLPLVKTSRSFP